MTVQTASKTDLYEEKREFFRATMKPRLVDLGEANYLRIDGEGSPDGPGFLAAIRALYTLAYSLKFAMKRRGRDFKVPTFEGDWWALGADSYEDAQLIPWEQWRWTLYMMLPDFVTEDDVESMKSEIQRKQDAVDVSGARFVRFAQGPCVQVLHVGPYADEPRTIAAIRQFMDAQGLKLRGHHHEVYLGDPRRAKPEALKTILRQPVAADAER